LRIPDFLWTSGAAFLGALILTPIIRDIFHAYNVVDRPSFRKVHTYPIPRLGGLSIAIAYLVALAWASGSGAGADAVLWKLVPGAAAILFTGMLDDFFNIRAVYKLLGQIAAAALAFSSGFRVDAIGGMALPLSVSLLVSVFWLLLAMNAFNLIDGLDGLCAGISFVGAASLYAIAQTQGNVPLEQITLPLMGALLGFLCYNFSRATMFLGDSGSLLIGYLIGCAGLVSASQGTNLSAAAPLMAIAVPLADLSLSVVRRFLSRRPIFGADRGHIHHRLLDRGLSPRRVVLVLYLWALAGGAFAFATGNPAWERWQPFLALGFCVTAWLGVRELRYSELTVAARRFFRAEPMKDSDPVRALASALEQSHSEDEWWDLLVTAARQAGWTDLLWIRDHAVWREQVFLSDAPPGWAFSLTLSESDSLQIHGPLTPARPAMEILGFADAVHRTFTARRHASDRPALS
jgi:UDP-GlcNAc:undecaprenyl-phosphate GlcNAc-1-phosphate transferase